MTRGRKATRLEGHQATDTDGDTDAGTGNGSRLGAWGLAGYEATRLRTDARSPRLGQQINRPLPPHVFIGDSSRLERCHEVGEVRKRPLSIATSRSAMWWHGLSRPVPRFIAGGGSSHVNRCHEAFRCGHQPDRSVPRPRCGGDSTFSCRCHHLLGPLPPVRRTGAAQCASASCCTCSTYVARSGNCEFPVAAVSNTGRCGLKCRSPWIEIAVALVEDPGRCGLTDFWHHMRTPVTVVSDPGRRSATQR